jgi:hypothetical protein
MSPAIRRVGFVCLPDPELEIFSEVSRVGHLRPEVVIDANPAACACKMAEILEIPSSADLTLLRRFPCDTIVVPDDRPDIRIDVAQIVGDAPTRVVACSEMRRELQLDVDAGAPAGSRSWSLTPLAEVPSPEPLFPRAVDPESLDRFVDSPRPDRDDRDSTPANLAETLELAGDKERLLQRILEIAVGRAGGDSGSIMLLDESGRHLRIVVSEGLSDEVIERTRQSIGDGPAGQVLRDGRSRILVDRLDDPRYRSGRERTDIKAAVLTPIRVGGRTVGVLNVSSDTRPDAFTEGTIEQMERFGTEVAGILLQAASTGTGSDRPAGERLEAGVESLLALEQPMESRVKATLEQLRGVTEAAIARLYWLDPTGRRLDVGAECGPVLPGACRAALPADQGLASRVLGRPGPTILTADFGGGGGSGRALLYLPIVADAPIGLVILEDLPETAARDEALVASLLRVARRLGERMAEDRSHQAGERRMRQLLELSDLASALLDGPEEAELAAVAVRSAASIFDADLVHFRPADGSMGACSDPEFAEGEGAPSGLLAKDALFAALALATGRTMSLDDAPRDLETALRGSAGFGWAVAVPLLAGESTATLTLYRRNSPVGGHDPAEAALLDRLGSHLTRALARLTSRGPRDERHERFMRWSVFQERLAEEMKRADRYERSFSLTRFELVGFRAVAARMGPAWMEAARFALADFLLDRIRELDIPCWVQDGCLAILGPETADLGGALGKRLEEEWRRLLPDLRLEGLSELEPAAAEILYPHDGHDWEAILDWLSDRFGEREAVRRAG